MKRDIINYELSKVQKPGQERFRLRRMPEVFAEEGFSRARLHTHSFYTIIWFEDGEGLHYVDFDKYEVRPGSVFFISPDQLHTFDASHYRQSGHIIEFSDDFLQDEVNSESLFLKYDVFNAYDTPPYRIVDAAGCTSLRRIIEELEREVGRFDAFAHHDCLTMLVKLFLITVQRYGHTADSSLSITSQQHRSFVRFRQLLEQNYHQLHTVGEYARLLGVSTKTLTSCTLESSHHTPLQLINARLVLEAKRLLRFTDFSGKEVAYQLGFDDPSYFVKFFKRHTGMLPLEFRAEQQII